MTSDLPLYLLGLLLITLITNFIINKFYKISNIKMILFTIISIVLGLISTMIMSYIESGSYKGTSFFGAIFLMPIFVLGLSFIFKIKYWKLVNLTAFLGMITSMLLKVRCFIHGCCVGRKIPIMIDDNYLTFPSQFAELFFAGIVFIILVILFRKNKDRKDLYPWMMVIYGIGRLNLQTFRLYKPVLVFLAWGHIWSIVSIIVGITCLVIIYKRKKSTT